MKKILYLFIAIISLSSCQSSDEDSLSGDPIVGKWQLQSRLENGTETTDSCERQSTVTFSADGTVAIVSYYDYGNNTCESIIGTTSWENAGNSNYVLSGNGQSSSPQKIDFSQNNTVWSTTTTDSFNGTTYTTIESWKKI